MEMPLADLLDRFTIVTLKLQRIGEQFRPEYDVYRVGVEALGDRVKPQWIADLLEINRRIWDLEAELKAGVEEHLSLEEIGRRAIEIRNANRGRIHIRNPIVRESGSGFEEMKIDHVSATEST